MNIPFLDDRQNRDVEFCKTYKNNFRHGADGHNRMITLALLAEYVADCVGGGDDNLVEDRPIATLCLAPEHIMEIERVESISSDMLTDAERTLRTAAKLFNAIDQHLIGAQRTSILYDWLGVTDGGDE